MPNQTLIKNLFIFVPHLATISLSLKVNGDCVFPVNPQLESVDIYWGSWALLRALGGR